MMMMPTEEMKTKGMPTEGNTKRTEFGCIKPELETHGNSKSMS